MLNQAVNLFRSAFRAVTNREVEFFSRAGLLNKSPLLPLRYTYRASDQGVIEYRLGRGGSHLSYALFGEEGGGADHQPFLAIELAHVAAGDVLRVEVPEKRAFLNERAVTVRAGAGSAGRKLIAHLQLSCAEGALHRQCPHYIPWDGREVGREYYFGADYKDYPLTADPHSAITLLQRYRKHGRLLDIGCALGIYTKAFLDAGYDAHGLDFSQYAVSEAAKRVGAERARQCDLDSQPIPFQGAFDILWAWDVLEHAGSPRGLLQKLTNAAAPGALLVAHTTNSDSLMHRAMGQDWEGFSDYSHRGVKDVTAANVRQWLKELGWKTLTWEISGIWASWSDPVGARLCQAFHKLPELRLMLEERELGDFLLFVAEKS